MRPGSLAMRAYDAILAAGSAGIIAGELCDLLSCRMRVLAQTRVRMKEGGLTFFTLFRSVKGGGIYFAQEDWRDAAQAAWRESVRQAQVASWKKRRDRWKLRQQEARGQAGAEEDRLRKNQREAERRRAARAAIAATKPPKPPKPPKAPAPPKAPKLHAIGQHMKATARDGRVVTKHQSTHDRKQPQATAKVQPLDQAPAKASVSLKAASARPVDYSRAIVTHCPSVRHDPRYQVDPGARVFGAGFAAVGIGRDINTGRGWE